MVYCQYSKLILTCMQYTPLIGRIFISLIFLVSGVMKIVGFSGQVSYASSAGLPLPTVAIVVAIVVEIVAGLMVLLGWQARFGAAALALYTIATALIFHTDFSQQSEQIAFMKNLAITGGLFYVIAHGAGAYSLDRGTGSTGQQSGTTQQHPQATPAEQVQ